MDGGVGVVRCTTYSCGLLARSSCSNVRAICVWWMGWWVVGGVWVWGLWGGTCCSSAVILSLAAEASLSTRSRAHASAIPCHPSPNS